MSDEDEKNEGMAAVPQSFCEATKAFLEELAALIPHKPEMWNRVSLSYKVENGKVKVEELAVVPRLDRVD